MTPTSPHGNTPDPELLRRSKISPHLHAMIADWEFRNRQETPTGARSPAHDAIPIVKVSIELKSPDTSELTSYGITFRHLFGNFFTAEVPLDRIDGLADLPSIIRVHREQATKPTLNDSVPEIRCNTVRNPQFPFGGTNKYTGLGVVVGIIDSGINILHPVFRLPNDQTKTRIIRILDQTQSPPVIFEKDPIATAVAANTQLFLPGAGTPRVETSINDHTHGTHVAGIAAGNGKVAGNCRGQFTYVGVAPEASLVIVKHDFAGKDSLQAAIQFIADTAAAIPGGSTPAVINMSLGHSLGPHDGTDPMDQMIDSWLGSRPAGSPPVVLVASAGNSGGHASPDVKEGTGEDDSHATGTIPPGGAVKTLRFSLMPLPDASRKGQVLCQCQIRFTAPNGVGCRLIPPDNNITGTNLAAPDGVANFVEKTQTSACQIQGQLLDATTGSRIVEITVTSANKGQNQPGDWKIELTNAGGAGITYHAWIDGKQADRFKDDLSRATTIGSPGSATRIISVGSYYVGGKNKGKISDSSSRGPRLDGLQKPDVSAPGEYIRSAQRDFHDGCCCDCCCDSYIDFRGTSMAAPHVTGAIALMLERNPSLTHDQVKTVLLAAARKDSFTGAANNNDFGNGKLDVRAALNNPTVANGLPDVTSIAPPRAYPRTEESLAARAAEALPPIPQLEPGTPLWRLLQTREGSRIYDLGRQHWEEARALVNSDKRIATVWHRNFGPLLLHHITRTTMLPDVPLPTQLEDVELSTRAARIVSALEPHASPQLRAALHTTLPWIARLQGKTLHQVVEMLEASELQHA